MAQEYLKVLKHLGKEAVVIGRNPEKAKKLVGSYGYTGYGGVACNGIHHLELFFWLIEGKEYKHISSQVYETFETKRKGFFDFMGNIKLKINSKTYFNLNGDRKDNTIYIQIITNKRIFDIFDSMRKLVTASNDSFEVSDFEVPFQSQLTSKLIKDIAENGKTSMIPDIHEVYLPHKILFEVMEKHNIPELNIT